MPTYLYWGEEDFNIELAVKRLRAKLLDPDWVAFNHKLFDNSGVRDIVEAASTIPMGFGETLIEVHNLNLFSRKVKKKAQEQDDFDFEKPSKKDEFDEKEIDNLIKLIPELPDRVNLLFVVIFPRGQKRKIDKNLKTTKTIDKYGVIQQFEAFSPFHPEKIEKWVIEAAKDYNVRISSDAARKLVECNGTELRKINSELKKLTIYKGEGNLITVDDVNELCSAIDNVFTLTNKWISAQRHDALVELQKILDKDHPVRVIATLQSLITEYLHIKLALKYGHKSTTLHKDLNMNPYRLKMIIKDLKYISDERLSHLREQLTIYENKIKTGQLNSELALEILMTM
ncbi:MAG: DNA polymerase III subunit delta [Cyanobacteriota bacterium]